MDLVVVLVLLGLSVGALGQFDPGCSFSNGQCIYNVKLGHEKHCDTASGKRETVSSGTSSGFQSCSCKDIDAVSHSVDSLFTSMTTLQLNFDQLASKLNATQEQLGMKTNEVHSLLSTNTNLTAKLTNTEMLLNKSKVDLANTVANMNKDLDQLRKQLTDKNNELKMCQAGLKVSGSQTSNPVLYSNFVTHYCDFEATTYCNYTIDSCTGEKECWYHGAGRQDTMSGPIEDHTYGSPKGHYMYIDPNRNAHYSSSSSTSHPMRKARITSPEFPPSPNYCLRFWYTMHGSDVRTLKVYARVGTGDGYPILTMSGQIDQYWHMAEIPISSEYTANPFRIVLEATTNSWYYNNYHSSSNYKVYKDDNGYIAFDDVYVYNTTCSSIPAFPAGSRKLTLGNETSHYTFHVTAKSWYDAVETCKHEAPNGHLVSINSKKEQEFLVDTIQSNAVYTAAGVRGWYTSGNDERTEASFKWTDTGFPYTLNYTNWAQGQPNNVGNVQNCLLMENSFDYYTWGDVNCADAHPFICEIKM